MGSQDKVLNEKSEVNIENTWQSFKKPIAKVAKSKLGQNIKIKKNPWITDKILNLMNKRRNHKNVNDQLYKQIQREIRFETEEHFANESKKIENYMEGG